MKQNFQRTILVFTIWICSVPIYSQEPGATTSEFRDFIEESALLAKQLEGKIPQDRYSFDSVIASVGTDPAKLANWVRTNTSMLPYSGVLKGASGTLMERRGNSLDRSLLLIELLSRAGHQADLLSVKLSQDGLREAQRRLLSQKALSYAPPRIVPAPLDLNQAISWENGIDGIDRSEVLESSQLLVDTAQDLLAILGESQIQANAIMARTEVDRVQEATNWNALLESLADHWWVRVNSVSGMTEYDLIFNDLSGDSRTELFEHEPATYSPAEATDAFSHSLNFRIVARQLNSTGEDVTHNLLEYESNTVDIGLSTIWLTFQSLGPEVDLTEKAELESKLKAQSEWLPILWVKGEPVSQSSIRSDGSINRSPAKSSMEKTASKMANAFAGISGSLSGIPATIGGGDSKSWSQLVSVHVIVERKRGGTRSQAVRTLFDLSERADELDHDDGLYMTRSAKFLSDIRYLTQSHDIDSNYRMEVMRKRLVDLGELAPQLAEGLEQGKFSDDALDLLFRGPPAQLSLAWGNLRRIPHTSRMAVLQPNLFSEFAEVSFRAGELHVSTGLDIVMNDMTALTTDQSQRIEMVIQQGAFDTLLEALLIGGNVSNNNAALRFRNDLRQNQARNWDAKLIARTELGPTSDRPHLAVSEGSSKFWLITDREISGSSPYWLVNSSTGATLGYGPDGRGSAVVEKIILIGNTLNVGARAVSLALTLVCVAQWGQSTACENAACFFGIYLTLIGISVGMGGVAYGDSFLRSLIMSHIGWGSSGFEVAIGSLIHLVNLGGVTGWMGQHCKQMSESTRFGPSGEWLVCN